MESGLSPFETLYEIDMGDDLPLPAALASLYGRIQFPNRQGRPHLISNFVTTLDGVVSLNEPGHREASEISGDNPYDRFVIGLLRALSDVVIAGASTLRRPPGHIWTAEYIYPPLAAAFQSLRATLGRQRPPINVIVTAQGDLDLSLPLFHTRSVQAVILTTKSGSKNLQSLPLSASVHIERLPGEGFLAAQEILEAVLKIAPRSKSILMEGGPHLMGEFLANRLVDELFLTLAPQVAGRDPQYVRPGLVSGIRLAPEDPRWGTLCGVKRAMDHLFLRYSFR